MKRSLAIFLCLSALLCLGGCGNAPESSTSAESLPTEETFEPVEAESTVIIAQKGGYTESQILTNVPTQYEGLSLSVRSDGTVDYIFSACPTEVSNFKNTISLANYLNYFSKALERYTISPDGQARKEPTTWIDPIGDAMETVSESMDQPSGWQISFLAMEETIYPCIRLASEVSPGMSISGYDYSALYCLKDGELTRVPFQWDEKYWGLSAAEDGFLAWYDLGRKSISGPVYSAFDYYAYDGTCLASVSMKDAPLMSQCFGAGGSTAWCCDENMVIHAIDIGTGKVLKSYTLEDEEIRQTAVTPDGTALYLLSSEAGKFWAKLQVFTADDCALVLQGIRYAIGDCNDPVSFMAAANNGTVYAVVKQNGYDVLLQYKKTP